VRGVGCLLGLVILVALAGCSESVDDHLARLRADAPVCWSYVCQDGPNVRNTPGAPIQQGLDCMNNALVSGTLARSSWSIDSFHDNTTSTTSVFTVDHQVIAFDSYQFQNDRPDVRELPACTGPFHIGESVCTFLTAGQIDGVSAIAWDGCP
jgi:hypothetical protein